MKIAVCAGEKSGDLLGYNLLKELKRDNDSISFIGVGGSLMESAGLKSFFPLKEISYMGLIDPLLNLKKILKRRQEFINFLKKEEPDIFIGIDSPSFNSGICKALKKTTNIKTVQYVCPQFWAWRYDRVKKFNYLYDTILSLFPFESELLKKHNVNHSFVGHPLAEQLLDRSRDFNLREELKISSEKKIIAILPGSRNSEIKHHEGPLIDFISKYKKVSPDAEIILALNKRSDLTEKLKKTLKDYSVVFNDSQKVLAACDLAVVASGTATLEASILAKPMVVIYKSNFLSNFILSNFFLKTKFIALPNILSKAQVVFELRQNEVTGNEIFKKVIITFKKRQDISSKLTSLRETLLVKDKSKFSYAINKLLSS